MPNRIIIVGGGAAGFFAAIRCAELDPTAQVRILERGKSVLEKVRISGGGRCNVTHACFDPRALVQHYPRGSRELLGAFTQFGPTQTVEWFESRGVPLKAESDGRMFPQSDSSQSIMDCLTRSAARASVRVQPSTRVERIAPLGDGTWEVFCAGSTAPLVADRLFLSGGSSTALWDLLHGLGHQIVPPVPSLFTFNCKDTRFRDLSGVSVSQAQVHVTGSKLQALGPLLITHWGLSGPAVLRLSAWGARELHERQHRFEVRINWLGETSLSDVETRLATQKQVQAKKTVANSPLEGIPARLWQNLVAAADIASDLRWADAGKKHLSSLAQQLCHGDYAIHGKSTFKEEFVTAGGVSLKEINFKDFSSKLLPNLYMAGEILDIDAITGGFNFQAAWTGAWIAANAMSRSTAPDID